MYAVTTVNLIWQPIIKVGIDNSRTTGQWTYEEDKSGHLTDGQGCQHISLPLSLLYPPIFKDK